MMGKPCEPPPNPKGSGQLTPRLPFDVPVPDPDADKHCHEDPKVGRDPMWNALLQRPHSTESAKAAGLGGNMEVKYMLHCLRQDLDQRLTSMERLLHVLPAIDSKLEHLVSSTPENGKLSSGCSPRIKSVKTSASGASYPLIAASKYQPRTAAQSIKSVQWGDLDSGSAVMEQLSITTSSQSNLVEDQGEFAKGNSTVSAMTGSQSVMKVLTEMIKERRATAEHSTLARRRVRNKHIDWLSEVLEAPELSTAGFLYSKSMAMFTIFAVLVSVIQTCDPPSSGPPPLHGQEASVTELFCDIVFVLEVTLRFAVCLQRTRFFLSPFNLLDVVASFGPLIMRLSVGPRLSAFDDGTLSRAVLLTVVPVLRMFKLLRHFEQIHLLVYAFQVAIEALPVLLFMIALIALTFAALIYLVEPRDNIPSYPVACWLTIVTMTTIGYGDITPQSAEGSLVVSVLVITSAIYMAIPVGIVGNAFSKTWQDRDRLLLMRRTRDRLLQGGFTAHDIPELFHLFDHGGSGALRLKQFHELMKAMRIGFSESRVCQLFQTFDRDGNNEIDDAEFVYALFPTAFAEIYHAASIAEYREAIDLDRRRYGINSIRGSQGRTSGPLERGAFAPAAPTVVSSWARQST